MAALMVPSFIFFFVILFICVHAQMYVCICPECLQGSQMPEEGVRSPETGVTVEVWGPSFTTLTYNVIFHLIFFFEMLFGLFYSKR